MLDFSAIRYAVAAVQPKRRKKEQKANTDATVAVIVAAYSLISFVCNK